MPVQSAITPSNTSADPGGLSPTEVCITIDTEFSIGGAFADPARYRPLSEELVDCRIAGRSEGLEFLLRSLRDFRMPATFFVEVLQCFYFGERPMGRVVERIAEGGHDLALHLHPGWLRFRDPAWRRAALAGDDCATRSADELREMIEFGVAQFSAWRLAPPKALRAGSFSCGAALHQAMSACGITLGSNIGLALFRPPDPEFHLASGTRLFDGVLEIPALTYAAKSLPGGSRLRLLAITSTSAREMEALLWAAHWAAISPVVVLTHPFEFVKHRDFRYRDMRCNTVNQNRLERLLDFVSRHNDSFSVTTFAQSGADWLAAGSRPGDLLQVPTSLALARTAENATNTLIWGY
jgi:hypothetical protein